MNTKTHVDYGGKPILEKRFYIDSTYGLSYIEEIGIDSIIMEHGPNFRQAVGKTFGDTLEERNCEVRDIAGRLMHLSNYDVQANFTFSNEEYQKWIIKRVKTLAKSPVKKDMSLKELRDKAKKWPKGKK